jgi:KDO2-lipid IV(A) lauroyltransferase
MAAPQLSVITLSWRLEALAFDAAAGLARLFPIDAVSDFGGWLLRTLGPLTPLQRVAETNLRLVFPNASDAEIGRLLRDQWTEVGRSFAEFAIVDRIAAEPERLEVQGEEILRAIAASGRPVVFISGHFSNFELMAAAMIRAGLTVQVTYRAMNNPYVDERVRRQRARYGVQLFAPKGLGGARELMRAIGRGESIALLNDQKFNGGVEAPLFGVPAHTAPGPSTYALRFGIPIVPLSVQRTGPGARFRVLVHEAMHLADTGDHEADIEAAVRRINAFMEARILARPAEWFWVHRRWPNEVYRR